MRLSISTILKCSAERAFKEVMNPAMMVHIAKPVVYFSPADGTALPPQWEEKSYPVRLRLFGFLPFGTQVIRTSGRAEQHGDGTHYILRDNGYSRLIRLWDHIIVIRPDTEHTCHYADRLEVKAGLMTPVVWLFALGFYAWRQRRWHEVIRNNFSY